jgi:transcriptional regulator with XRE-family HTH domain
MTCQVMEAATPARSMPPMLHAAAPPPATAQPFGDHLRRWRRQRRLSQEGLAGEAGVSTRHLSCVETGRALPSREMVLRLADRLQVPLRERNAMLVAAGYAPLYRERPFHDPALAGVRAAVERLLAAHEPWPALAADRHWNLLAANRMLPLLLQGVDPALLAPVPNVLRLALHPGGLAPRIANLGQVRAHLLERLHQQAQASGDAALQALGAELAALPCPADAASAGEEAHPSVALPIRLRLPGGGELALLSATTVFGTAADITVQELTLETFLPADAATAERLRQLAQEAPGAQQAAAAGAAG